MRHIVLPLLLAFAAAPAVAEVKSAAPVGFDVETKAVVDATPAETYAALTRVGEWWDSEHTYSGDARNMRLQAEAGGCFCETLPADGGTIEHARIVYARPGETLRLQGGLGPLQSQAVIGTLTWQLKPVAGGTEVTQSYVAGGYVPGGADKLAPIVDQVLARQLSRLSEYLAGKRAESGN